MPYKGKPKRGNYSKGKYCKPSASDNEATSTLKVDNDPSWYKKYPQLVQAASSIIFNHPYGYVYDNKRNIVVSTNTDFNAAIPGGYVATFRPAITAAGTPNEPINVFVKNLYTFVRHANSGSVNYDSSDLAQYVLTVLGLIPHIEHAKRVMRLVLTYKATNRYVYHAMLEAMGFSVAAIQDMITNYAQYVSQLNILISQFNTFKVPREFSIIDRWSWLSSNVFKDDELDKASLYAFKPGTYYHYDWANAQLVETQMVTSYLSSYISDINAEVTNLLSYEDIGIMIGDILKAYKNEACYVMSPLTLGDVQDAVFSAEAGEQFRNMCVTGYIATNKIKQAPGNSQLLVSQPTSVYQTNVTGKLIAERTLDPSGAADIAAAIPVGYRALPTLMADSDSPDADKVIVNTRLMHSNEVLAYSTGGVQVIEVKAHGTEVITDVMVFAYGKTAAGTQNLIMDNFYDTFGTYYITQGTGLMSTVSKLTPTRYAPHFNCVIVADASTVLGLNLLCGVNNLVLEDTFLDNLHLGCLLSLFTLPMFKLLESN